MQTAVNLVRPQAENRAIRIQVQGPVEPVICNVDPVRIQQVVLNLLSNAVKFTPEGGQVSASLKLRRDLTRQPDASEEVAIEIVDTGIGISPEFLPYVFDRFSQANGGINRRYGGLGLGLAITRALVHMHGGTLSAESDGVDRGSRFTVALPASVLVNVTAPDSIHFEEGCSQSVRPLGSEEIESALNSLMNQQPDPSRPDKTAARIGHSGALPHTPEGLGLRILIVEDSVDTLNMLTTWLESLGSDVRTAPSAVEALTVAADYRPNLVISDIGMPDVDGYEFIKGLRKVPGLEEVAAIALTGYAREEDREMALAAGYDEHIAKPAQMGQLLAIVKGLTGKSTSIEPE
jgi:CheY-like chemotaxis protein